MFIRLLLPLLFGVTATIFAEVGAALPTSWGSAANVGDMSELMRRALSARHFENQIAGVCEAKAGTT